MHNKPSYKTFIKSTIFNKKCYFVYKENNKLYKEVGAFKARLKKEIILVVIPLLILLVNYLIHNFTWYKEVNGMEFINYIIMIVIPFILVFLYLKRYDKVEFEEIQDATEAKDTKIRFIEIFLGVLYMYEVLYFIYLIQIM